jgi:hypothetical protein
LPAELLSDITHSRADLMAENAMPTWTEKNYHLTKFPPKIPKNIADEASSQYTQYGK